MLLPQIIEFGESGAKFSVDRTHRYLLWRKIGSGSGNDSLLVVGLNPSTADESANDPTIRRCLCFAKDWGFSTLLVANLFAFRATKPEDLRRAVDPIGYENDEWLRRASEYAGLTLAAWGNDGLWLKRDQAVATLLKNPHCLGQTIRGAPRHPLYVNRAQQPVPFDALS